MSIKGRQRNLGERSEEADRLPRRVGKIAGWVDNFEEASRKWVTLLSTIIQSLRPSHGLLLGNH